MHRPHHTRSAGLAALTAALIAAPLALTAAPVHAVTGVPVTHNAYGFATKLEIGEGDKKRACSGALVDTQWVLTAASCFADVPGQGSVIPAGKPALKTIATIGRADLTATGGHVSEVIDLVPRPDRDLVMARLAQPATGITPVAMATTPAAQGDTVIVAGYGRTKTEWVPDKLHTATFAVNAVTGTDLNIAGTTANDAICKGDTGAPLLRDKNGTPELVAISSRSWQGGCFGETETRTDAIAARADNTALGSRLAAGRRLNAGDTLVSASAKLTMQADGNLVITSTTGKILWSTGTAGNTGATARLDTNGNLLVRNAADTTTLWESKTSAAGGYAVLQDRGNLVIHNAQNASQWSSNSAPRHDYNGDGRSDMADWYDFGDGKDGLHTYIAGAEGTLASPRTGFLSAGNQWTLSLTKRVTGDFNGDGFGDVAVMYDYADNTAKLWTFLGKGDGTFNTPFESWKSSAGSFDPSRVTLHAGDFNADGRDDIAAWYDYASGEDALFSFLADSRGGFAVPAKTWSAPNNWTVSLAKYVTGDYNGDGRQDIAVLYDYAGGSVKLWTFLATPSGGFDGPKQAWASDTWGDWSRTHPHAGDFNGDGRDDIAFWFDYTDGRDTVFTLAANTDGTFAAPQSSLAIAAGSVTYTAMKMVSGDYNGDGRDDLATMYGYSDGSVRMFTWTKRADATFDSAKTGWISATANSWDFALTHFLNQDS
ncbi:FG-GAP-like repeat-containing protein [Streptomyces sp. NPDC052236]|uniref:FG-GAP-like repeat-containing protein n=1 Tax=Streptomyces sp. NPDC052236 TaxID=3365686 RepID=UPI0037D74DE0